MMAGPQHSKLIAARLRAGALRQPAVHPDADLLSAFSGGCLNDAERAKVMEHLGECTVCRDVVYLARPEDDAAMLQPVKTRSSARWFAWGGLRWAALAASMSVVIAVAILVRTNPERQSPTSSALDKQAAKPATAPPNSASEPHAFNYDSSPAAEARERIKTENPTPKVAESRNGAELDAPALASRRALSRDEKDLGLRSLSDGGKLGRLGSANNKEPAKQPLSSDLERRGFVGGTLGSASNAATAEEKGRLFDLRQQQQSRSGPYVNMNSSNSIQNQVYPPADSQAYAAAVPASPPAARPDKNGTAPEATQQASAKPSTSLTDAFARKKTAPEQGVVPAEEAHRKNLETIPTQAPSQGKEETVAVAGQLQSYDRVTRASASPPAGSGSSAKPVENESKIDDLNHGANSRGANLELAPGVAPSSAITGWRLHHGRVQERLYGIWHNVVVSGEERVESSRITEVVSSKQTSVAIQPRFVAVTSARTDVWAVEAIRREQSYIVIHHSRDNGVTWQASTLTNGAVLSPGAQISISFKDANQGELALSTGERWQSTDGGAHWTSVK